MSRRSAARTSSSEAACGIPRASYSVAFMTAIAGRINRILDVEYSGNCSLNASYAPGCYRTKVSARALSLRWSGKRCRCASPLPCAARRPDGHSPLPYDFTTMADAPKDKGGLEPPLSCRATCESLFAALLALRELLADPRRLPGASAQIVELGPPHIAFALDFDRRDQWRIRLDRALDAFAARDLAHDE